MDGAENIYPEVFTLELNKIIVHKVLSTFEAFKKGSFYFLSLRHGISAWYIICQEVVAFSSSSLIEQCENKKVTLLIKKNYTLHHLQLKVNVAQIKGIE